MLGRMPPRPAPREEQRLCEVDNWACGIPENRNTHTHTDARAHTHTQTHTHTHGHTAGCKKRPHAIANGIGDHNINKGLHERTTKGKTQQLLSSSEGIMEDMAPSLLNTLNTSNTNSENKQVCVLGGGGTGDVEEVQAARFPSRTFHFSRLAR